MKPPARLMYQNPRGTRLSALRSEASHCTTHRIKKIPCQRNPIPSHIVSTLFDMIAILTEPDKTNGQCRCRNFERYCSIEIVSRVPQQDPYRTLETVSDSVLGMPMAPMKNVCDRNPCIC